MSATTPQTLTATTAAAPSSSGVARFVATRPVWLVSIAAVLVGAVVTEAFALVTRAAGVPMEAASPGETEAAEIPVGGFAGGVVFWAIAGIVLAIALGRWAKRPARTWVITTTILTVASFAGPIVAPHTAVSTQIVLSLAHVVAAAVIIPPIAHRLSHLPRQSR
jgi:hypothetical protein